MSELIDRQALLDSVYKNLPMIPSMSGMTAEEMRLRIAVLIENAPTASSWHRVEEPPKEVGCYLVVGFDRHWFYDIAEYFPIDNEWVMNENQSDSTYIRYWMPLPEPPQEVQDATEN